MEVTEATQDPSNQFENAVRGNISVRNAATMEYLGSARGHYFSALAKQEQTRSCALQHSAEKASVLEDPAQLTRLPEIDVQMQLPKGLLKASDKASQSVMVEFNKALTKNTRAQIEDVVDKLGLFGNEICRKGAADIEVMTAVLSDFGDANMSLFERVRGSNSIQQTVESLKAELQNLKREHAELEDKDLGVDSGPKNSNWRFSHSKPEREGCLEDESKSHNSSEEASQNMIGVEMVKGRGLNREHKTYSEIQKRPRVPLYVEEASMSAFDMSVDLPEERMYAACVSTSVSSARIMNSEDELESSSQKPGKAVNLERETFLGMETRIGANNSDYVSEFSIRDYVFSSRTKDICTNWPFSEKNLTLFLKHGVKNVLPPFQPADSWREGSVKRCSVVKSVPSEESNINGRPLIIKSHLLPNISSGSCWNGALAEGYRDSDQFQSGREKELEFKMVAIANCQSEVESVSTSNLPFSVVVSDEREASASGSRKAKASSSQICNTKGSILKSRNSCWGAPEEITSACTVPLDAMASKICPVCEKFSSSSNTTLNAHIDQCLSSQSSAQWVKNSLLIKPRIKPRKMRSMVDICATASCCTLEDLDRRNGTNWASNEDFPSDDTEVGREGTNRGVGSRYVICCRDDDSVYIDSNGRKIRILSKFNEISSSFPKSRDDLKLKKKLKKGNRSQFITASRKRCLAKHLKYLRVTCPKKGYLSTKVKEQFVEAFKAEETTFAVRDTPAKQKFATSPWKGLNCYEPKNCSVVGTSSGWMSSEMDNVPTKMDSESDTKASRYDLRATKDLRVRGSHSIAGRTRAMKHTHLRNKPLSPINHGLKIPVSDYADAEQKSVGAFRWENSEQRIPGSCCGRTLSSPPRDVVQGNGERKFGAGGFSTKNPMEFVQRSLGSMISSVSSVEGEVEFESDSVRDTVPVSQKVVQGSSLYPFVGNRIYNSESGMLSHDLSYVHECQSNSKLNGSVVKSCYCSEDEVAEAYYDGTREQFGAKKAVGKQQHPSEDSNRFSDFTDGAQGKYGMVQAAKTVHDSRKLVAPVLPTCLAVGETDLSLNMSSDPQSEKVAYLSASCSDTMHCLDKSQDPELGPNIHFIQHGLRDKNRMFYGDVTAVERLQVKTMDAILNYEQGGSFVEIDPIPIPGPPGCDLPSFSDMGSEDLDRSKSSSSDLEHSFHKGDDVFDGDLTDSLLSATSTISSLCVTDDPAVNEEAYLRATPPVNDSASQGWLVASALSSVETPVLHSPAATSERLSALAVNIKDGPTEHARGSTSLSSADKLCCSRKEGIPSTAAQGSQSLWRRATSFVPFCRGEHTDSPLIKWPTINRARVCSFSSCPRGESEKSVLNAQALHKNTTFAEEISPEVAVQFPRTCDSNSDSACPAPILRLMGKNLMVINNDEADHSFSQTAQNFCMNGEMHLVTAFSSGLEKGWERQPPRDPAFLASPPYGQDPRVFSVQQLDVQFSNMARCIRSPYHA